MSKHFEYTLASVTNKRGKTVKYFTITSIVWILLFVSAIVISITLYDAQLSHELEVLTMLAPPPPPPPPPPPKRNNGTQKQIRTVVTKTTTNVTSYIVPNSIPLPTTTKTDLPNIGNGSDYGVAGGVEGGVEGGVLGGVVGGVVGGVLGGVKGGVVGSVGSSPVAAPPPPPPPQIESNRSAEIPEIVRRSEGVIRGNAITRVVPDYPLLARNANVQGTVQVSILIDENGDVIKAEIISGPLMLQQTALQATLKWKFKPTLLNQVPVKVAGVLTYNFSF